MAQFYNIFPVELNAGAAPVVSLKQIYFGDHHANRVGAFVLMDGAPYTLDGNCAGTAILADGSTVPLTGVISENLAYIDLDSACYQVEGQIAVFVKWVSDTLETTLLSAVGTVKITETGNVIQPSTPVPDLAQLMAQITAMQEATAAANAAAEKAVRYDTAQFLTRAQMDQARLNIAAASYVDIAPTFSASTDYAAGDIVMYQGTLYRFSSAHAAGAWTGTDVGTISVEESVLWRFVRFDTTEGLSGAQKANARQNIQAAQVTATDFNGSDSGLYIEY